jgi:hypothetical protein
MGNCTSARRKILVKEMMLKERVSTFSPQQLIC